MRTTSTSTPQVHQLVDSKISDALRSLGHMHPSPISLHLDLRRMESLESDEHVAKQSVARFRAEGTLSFLSNTLRATATASGLSRAVIEVEQILTRQIVNRTRRGQTDVRSSRRRAAMVLP